jgi:hypothetical protein
MAKMDGYDLLMIDTSSGNLCGRLRSAPSGRRDPDADEREPGRHARPVCPARFGRGAAINYREMIDTVRFDRKRAGLPVQQWHV